MITISDTAMKEIMAEVEEKDIQDMALRVAIVGRGPGGFRYSLGFVPMTDIRSDDNVIEVGELKVLIDPESVPNLEGASLVYNQDQFRRGFQFDNPNPLWKDPTAQSVQEVIDKKINPGLAMHRGFVTLLEVKDSVAYISFGGGCQGCGLIDVTMKQGVEVTIREAVPQIKQVLDTTDHTGGTNPYHQPGE